MRYVLLLVLLVCVGYIGYTLVTRDFISTATTPLVWIATAITVGSAKWLRQEW